MSDSDDRSAKLMQELSTEVRRLGGHYINQFDEEAIHTAVRTHILRYVFSKAVFNKTLNKYSVKDVEDAVVTTLKGHVVVTTIAPSTPEKLKKRLTDLFLTAEFVSLVCT